MPAAAAATLPRTVVLRDRQTNREVAIEGLAPAVYHYPRFSFDETKLALDVRGSERNINIWNFSTGILAPFTYHEGLERLPLWLPPRGEWLMFSGQLTPGGGEVGDGVLLRQAADGRGTPQRVDRRDSTSLLMATSATRDGSTVVAWGPNGTGQVSFDIMLVEVASGKVSSFLNSADSERNGELSPDDRFIAYESNRSGRFEIYVQPFPSKDGLWQVSTDGGTHAVWRNGELFYVAGDGSMRVVTYDPPAETWSKVAERTLFRGDHVFIPPSLINSGRMYDVSRDAQRFVLLKDAASGDGQGPNVMVWKDWTGKLQALGGR
jgi:hypothetical protein